MVYSRRAVLRRLGILGGVGALALAQDSRLHDMLDRECFRPDAREMYGPTDISAQTANGRLAAGINQEGTVSVFRWPTPSRYDQLAYFAEGRDEKDDIVVDPGDGCFLGIAGENGETTWLREMSVERHTYDRDDEGVYSDEVLTEYTDGERTVIVRDLVGPDTDALVRHVTLEADEPVTLVGYANLALTVSKRPQMPIEDWCLTGDPDETTVTYEETLDAVVHERDGVDETTGEEQAIRIAVGFDRASEGHVVAPDALSAAESVPLTGPNTGDGAAACTLATSLEPGGSTSLVVAAGRDRDDVETALSRSRTRSFTDDLRQAKEHWLEDLLAEAPLPATDDEAILSLCRRALVTLVTVTEDTENRAVVASISSQPPYALDWVRDGAYFNRVLELIGLDDWVTDRNRWYAELQQPEGEPRDSHPLTPPGNWAMNYYGDGVAGGPIPYQIDQTGYGIWNFWRHYEVTGDEEYLADVYPAIELAAEWCLECRDPETGLHCVSWEDDNPMPRRPSIVGAAAVWMGLGAAAAAARDPASPGTEADAERYEERRHEVGRAIDQHLYDGEEYGNAETAWPVRFRSYVDPDGGELRDRPQVDDPLAHPRMQSHLASMPDGLSDVVAVPEEPFESGHGDDTGQYQTKSTIPLAMSDDPELRTVARETLEWVSTHHAREDTRVMGEAWQVLGPDREVRSIVGQPHVWSQLLAYLTALELDPPPDYDGFEWEHGHEGARW